MSDTDSAGLARDIEILAALFKASGWHELRVESEGLSLLLSNDSAAAPLGGQPMPLPAGGAMAAAVPSTSVVVPPVSPPALSPAPVPAPVSGAVDPAWTSVVAPNLGTFYRSPKPGAAPFVEIGQRVEAATEICLIEVMKLFTSVQAGVAGIVRHIAVADAELVEGGQALIYIERDGTS